MNTSRFVSCLALAGILLTCQIMPAQQPLRSSLQPGERIAAEFHCLNVTGKHAGKRHCLVCENGLSPVAMVFARSVDEPLLRLLVQLDAATAKNAKSEMGSFVVFLSADAELPAQLKKLAGKHSLKHLVLSVYDPAGPDGFQVAKEADVTVVLYREFIVGANHAFKKGELSDVASAKIVADLPRILEVKKKAK
jgi:hypothetical protein